MENTQDKKKILYLVTKSEPFGGAQKYVYDLATNLPEDKWDVTVVFGGSGVLAEKLAHTSSIRTISLTRLARDIHITDEIAVFFSLIGILHTQKPDMLHLSSSKSGGLGALAGRMYNALQRIKRVFSKQHIPTTRILFTVHGWPFNERRPVWQRALIYTFSWLTVLLTHKTITVSHEDMRQGRSMWFTTHKLTAVHNGLSPRQFMEKERARHALLGDRYTDIPQNATWIGSIAELTKNKGISYAVKGVHRLLLDNPPQNPIVYVIIGTGEERYHLAHLIETLGLQQDVFLAGFKEDAAQYLKAFDIFLFPSIKEGLPYALLEAGNAGLPVIATGVGGVPEIIKDMETGILIRPGEVGEIKAAISFAIANEKQMNDTKKALKSHIEEEFSMEKMLTKIQKLYS